MKETLKEIENEKKIQKSKNILLSKNAARLELGIGYDKLERFINQGFIKTTPDGDHITLFELNNYRNNHE